MQVLVGTARSGSLPVSAMEGMHRLRYEVFRQRLRWDIPAADQQERDGFDDCNPVFILARADDGVVGCCRILPTTGPYMLKDTFPQLLGSTHAPVDPRVWEISRFAVAKSPRPGIGFSSVPATLIRQLVRHAVASGIDSYVFVTTTAFERLLRHLGVHIERIAAPLQIGIERSVALWMHVDTQTVLATGASAVNDSMSSVAQKDAA